MRTKQRYRCKACGLNFTDTPPRGKPLALKVAAVLLYVSGLSIVDEPHRQVARRLDTHHPGLARAVRGRLRAKTRARGSGRGDRARRDVALSEKKSEPLWIWKAWDRASGQLVDWECGGRDKATCERLIARLTRWRTRLYCADDYAVYGVLLPVGQLLYGQGRDARHRAGQRPPAALARPVPTALHRGLEGQAGGGRQHRPVRPLCRERQDRRPHIYAGLKPSVEP